MFTLGEGQAGELHLDPTTTLRDLGRPLRLAQHDCLVAVSLTAPAAVAWKNNEVGTGFSEQLGIGAVVEILGTASVYAAEVAGLLPEPLGYSTAGFGWGSDADGAFGTAVYLFASEVDAAQFVPTTESRYLDGTVQSGEQVVASIDMTDITVQGAAVVVTVRFPTRLPHLFSDGVLLFGTPSLD